MGMFEEFKVLPTIFDSLFVLTTLKRKKNSSNSGPNTKGSKKLKKCLALYNFYVIHRGMYFTIRNLA